VNLALFNRESSDSQDAKREVQGIGSPALAVQGRSYSNVVAPVVVKKVDDAGVPPVLDVCPSKEALELLRFSFVGLLRFPRDAKLVQTSIFMEGWSGISVTDMGGNLVLLNNKVDGTIEATRPMKVEWWEANFSWVKPWSPQMVARKRKVWVKL